MIDHWLAIVIIIVFVVDIIVTRNRRKLDKELIQNYKKAQITFTEMAESYKQTALELKKAAALLLKCLGK